MKKDNIKPHVLVPPHLKKPSLPKSAAPAAPKPAERVQAPPTAPEQAANRP